MEVDSKFYWGIFLVAISIILILIKKILLDIKEDSGDELFKKEYRHLHELRVWIIIISFFVLGLWLIINKFL